MVVCPVCGKEAQDSDYCEGCDSDLRVPDAPATPAVCPLPDGDVALDDNTRAALRHPDRHVLLAGSENWWRVHWLDRDVDSDWHASWNFRQTLTLRSIPQVRTRADEDGAWIFVPTTGNVAAPWLMGRTDPPLERVERCLMAVEEIALVLEELHEAGLFWMNFDPSELERDDAGRLRITNLDLRVFHSGQAPYTLAVNSAFAAPEVVYLKAANLGPRTDVYHLAAYTYYALAGRLPIGLPGDGLEAIDFHLPALRVYAPDLPEGLRTVLDRGMSPEAHHRFATPAEFAQQLRDAFDRATRRRSYAGPVTWEIGSHSRTGRSKSALKRSNEDQVLVRRYTGPDRALVAVADGITTCDIGDGALASLIATIVVENGIEGMADSAEFPRRIREACMKSTRTLLDWAVEKGHADELRAGQDLMGTTLTAGWLQGNSLTVANLGDSRAYLIEDMRVEQLTVDGDLASDLLGQGMAPEKVRELGMMTRALRKCIGGCEIDESGEPVIVLDCAEPSITHWKLMPGDIVVLCSDGLVEEGAFLEPELLVEIVRNHPRASPQDLAEIFAEAADSLQRLPSPTEPEGFGDNISCVVIKVSTPHAAGFAPRRGSMGQIKDTRHESADPESQEEHA
jgi:protein phosphatase